MRYYEFFRVSTLLLIVSLAVAGQGRVEAETIVAWGDPGHSFVNPTGTNPAADLWYGNGTNINEHYPFPQDNGATSNREFTGLANGTYYVSADWTTFSNRTTSARYTISDGGTDAVVNQQDAARDFYEFASGVPVGWLNLGQVTVSDGNLSITASDDNTVPGGFLLADAIRISTTPGVSNVPGIGQGIVVDNGDLGHAFLGEVAPDPVWAIAGGGFGDDNAFDNENSFADHTGALQSTWTITGLTPGKLTNVSTTWVEFSNRGTDVPFTISGIDGGDQTVLVNQQLAPNGDVYAADFTAKAYPFQSLGTFTPTGSSITVTMSNNANGFAIADAVRVQQVPEPSTAVLLVLGSLFSSLLYRRKRQHKS